MKYLICILTTFFFVTLASSQHVIQWQKSFGGSEFDEAKSIIQTKDGGYVSVGPVLSPNGDFFGNHGGYDFGVLKLTADGISQWKKTLGGTETDWPNCILESTDGGYIIAGYTESNNGDVTENHGNKDAWIVKLNATGDVQWKRCYGGSAWEEATAIQQTIDGGYIFAGIAQSSDGDVTGVHGDLDYWVVKINSNGEILWQKAFGGTGEDIANDIKLTSDGGFIVVGKSDSADGDITNTYGSDDYWLIKLTNNGEISLTKNFGGNSADVAEEVWQTFDGGFIMIGYVLKNTSGEITGHHGGIYDAWVIKTDSLGTLEWQRALGGSWLDFGRSVQQTSDGKYIIAGTTVSLDGDVIGLHSENYSDGWLIKLNQIGQIDWQKTIGGTNDDALFSIEQTNDGGFIAAGFNWSIDGDASSCKGYNDFWIVKLSPESSATSTPPAYPIQIFPNPAQQSITLNLPTTAASLSVCISDVLGRSMLRQTGMLADAGSISLEVSALPAGVYLVSAVDVDGGLYSGRFLKE